MTISGSRTMVERRNSSSPLARFAEETSSPPHPSALAQWSKRAVKLPTPALIKGGSTIRSDASGSAMKASSRSQPHPSSLPSKPRICLWRPVIKRVTKPAAVLGRTISITGTGSSRTVSASASARRLGQGAMRSSPQDCSARQKRGRRSVEGLRVGGAA